MDERCVMSELPDYHQVLEMLSEKAAGGSVSALICLERALRPENQPPEDDELDEALARVLQKGD
jgi:hypothetical protein